MIGAIVVSALSLFVVLYFFYTLWASWKLSRVEPFNIQSGPLSPPELSVVIPFRNEEKHLEALCADLKGQRFPSRFTTLFFVDDHSTDGSTALLEKLTSDWENASILSSQGEGKKAALTTGIQATQGAYVVTTDADCRLPEGWLQTIADAIIAYRPSLLILPVVEEASGASQKIRALDFLSLSGTTAVFASQGKPIMANGANLVFSKSAFEAVGGYAKHAHISSGDDVFLSQAIAQAQPNGIHYILHQSATVRTATTETWSQYFAQRSRWGSKTSKGSLKGKALAWLVFLTNLTIIVWVVYALLEPVTWRYVAIFWGAKVLVDLLFLSIAARKLGQQKLLAIYPLAAFIYPFQLAGTALLSIFSTPSWKGRKIST